MNTDKGKSPIQNPFHMPCKNILSHSKKSSSCNKTPLTPSERLIFFLRDRQNLIGEVVRKLPDEIYYKIMQTPSTAEANLIHKINQLSHTFPENSQPVIRPNSSILRLLLNPDTPQSQKIWAIENGLYYGLVSDSYRDRIHLFPTLTTASAKLRGLCSDRLYFKFHSIPPNYEDEEYQPAQHIVFVTEYYGWWDSFSVQFLSPNGDEFYNKGLHPVPPEISSINLRIDKVYTQLQLQQIMEAFPSGYHIFHHSANWIFATNEQGILKLLVPKFSGNFIHEPRWPTYR